MTSPYHLHTNHKDELSTTLTPQQEREAQLLILERHVWTTWLCGWLLFSVLALAAVLTVAWLCWPSIGEGEGGKGTGQGSAQHQLGVGHGGKIP